MNLRDGVIDVRDALGDYTENVWTTSEILRHLNISARRMCSAAQNLNEFQEPVVTANEQETFLSLLVNVVMSVKYFNGTLFDLQWVTQRYAQTGGFQGGTPVAFYLRQDTRELTPQGNSGDILPQWTNAQQEYTVIGLYPTPNQGGRLRVSFIAYHPYITQPMDRVQIPDDYFQGWTAYAKARCFEKRSDLTKAQYFDAIHSQEKQSFQINTGFLAQAVSNIPYESANEMSGINTGASSVVLLGGQITQFNM